MNKQERIARLAGIPSLEWRVRAVVEADLLKFAAQLELEFNSLADAGYHIGMIFERPEKDGIVLVAHKARPDELPGGPDPDLNPTAN